MSDVTSNSYTRRSNDGYYEIKYLPDGVYITVFPEIGKGIPVTIESLKKIIMKKNISNLNERALKDAVSEKSSEKVKIAPPQEENLLKAEINIAVNETKMKATLFMVEGEDKKIPTLEELHEALRRSGVIFGYKEDILKTISETPFYNKSISIAEGAKQKNGKNGFLEFYGNFIADAKPQILEDGRVDYKNLNIVKSVEAGQKLCKIIGPDLGEDGSDVFGKKIKSIPGKPVKNPKGKNVILDKDNETLIAQISGKIEYIEGKVNVFPVFSVEADIDTSTGNIDFLGSVVINGNVLSGFTVKASGNIEVEGVVEAATLIAGGNIIVKRGVQGGGKAFLKSGYDITSKYLEYCKIEAVNDIRSEALMHCDTKVGNAVYLTGRRGLLIGGCCKVANLLEVKTIGNHMSTATQVEIGTDPTLKERYKELNITITQKCETLKKSEQVIHVISQLAEKGSISHDKAELLNITKFTIEVLKEEISQFQEEIEIIREKMEGPIKGKIRVSEKIFNGTKLTFGTVSTYIRDVQSCCSVYLDGADIKFGSY